MAHSVKIQLLLTGNELMSGTTVDSNSARIADALSTLGLAVSRKVTVGDDMATLASELQQLSASSDILIVNGGLGPTLDDLSAEALAQAFGLELESNATARKHVEDWCVRVNASLSEANLKQAMLPKGVSILANPVGSAVGFSIEQKGCLILFTPGVPSELEAMLEVAILPLLKTRFPNVQDTLVERFHCFGIGEASVQQTINNKVADWPEAVQLSFRAGAPTLEIKLSILREEDEHLRQWCQNKLYELFGDLIVAKGNENLASNLVRTLASQHQRVTFAESCTGGKIASMLTEVAGASQVFEAGFVTYSNHIKHSVLGVNKHSLEKFGAVSETVATEMLLGALDKSGADLGAAVSGIAGPDGGSKEKPVGTVCIAWGSKSEHRSVTLVMPRSRQKFQLMVAACALDLLRRQLDNIGGEAPYFRRWQKQ